MQEGNGGGEKFYNFGRKNEKCAKLPIIAMTADAFSENIAECLAVGMNGHIAKPVDIKIVLKEIRKVKESKK